ncbi:MAG: hypothetical protein ACO2PN_16810 [Pyrobaculum sp.]
MGGHRAELCPLSLRFVEVPLGGFERLLRLPPRLLFCSAGCSGLISLGLTPWRDLPPSMERALG